MFTGLVEATGVVTAHRRRGPSARLSLRHTLGAVALGESIAVNGACLTVVDPKDDTFDVDVSAETLARTTLGDLKTGSAANLERSLRVGDRLGGHWVTGHVDAVTTVSSSEPVGEARRVRFTLPASLRPFVATKGSIALDGVSLTVNEVTSDHFAVMLIPHTLNATTLGRLAAGTRINLEIDVLARYAVNAIVQGVLVGTRSGAGGGAPAEDALARALERAGLL